MSAVDPASGGRFEGGATCLLNLSVVVSARLAGCDHLPQHFNGSPLFCWEVALDYFFGPIGGHAASRSQRLDG